MVIRFCMIPLVAIRFRSTIVRLDKNHYRNLGQQEKLVLQAAIIINDIKNNNSLPVIEAPFKNFEQWTV